MTKETTPRGASTSAMPITRRRPRSRKRSHAGGHLQRTSFDRGRRAPRPVIAAPTDAIVRIVLSCVCGSDLWYYRGESPHDLGAIGHEFIGAVEQVGPEVRGVAQGDFVIAPFIYCDGTCSHCLAGVTSQCVHGGGFGNHGIDGGQGEAVRVPLAGSTLVRVRGSGYSDETMRSLLALSDVMCTGHHAAVSAGSHHRPQPEPIPPGGGARVWRDRHPGGARRRGDQRRARDDEWSWSRRHPRMRGH